MSFPALGALASLCPLFVHLFVHDVFCRSLLGAGRLAGTSQGRCPPAGVVRPGQRGSRVAGHAVTEGSEAPCTRPEPDVTQGELAVMPGQRPQEEKQGGWEGLAGKGRGPGGLRQLPRKTGAASPREQWSRGHCAPAYSPLLSDWRQKVPASGPPERGGRGGGPAAGSVLPEAVCGPSFCELLPKHFTLSPCKWLFYPRDVVWAQPAPGACSSGCGALGC